MGILIILFLDHAINEHFIDSEYLNMVLIDENPNILIDKMMNYTPLQIDKAERAIRKSSYWSN